MQQDWTIQSRGHHCNATGRGFTEGEIFYTLLYDEQAGYRREDLCDEAYKSRPEDAPKPFSFWRTKYTPPPPAAPEPLGKQSAEDLLRSYMTEQTPQYANARYLLAVMLERKRILKEVDTKRGEDGSLIRVYEHGKTGEVFVIPDPELKLDELEQVQMEVVGLLSPSNNTPAPEPAPAEEATAGKTADAQASEPAEESGEAPAEKTEAANEPGALRPEGQNEIGTPEAVEASAKAPMEHAN